jgi:hypothetical protein
MPPPSKRREVVLRPRHQRPSGLRARNQADKPSPQVYILPVNSNSLELKEAWRERYRATSEALEIVRAQEVAAMTDEQAFRKTLSLRLFAEVPREPNDWSGLVVQQAIFHRRRGP